MLRHFLAGSGSAPQRLTFDAFLRSDPGALLLGWEREAYGLETQDAFGATALQIGMPEMDSLAENRIQSKWIIEPQKSGSISLDILESHDGRIVADPEHLPIANESMDLVTLPHVLDFSENPQQALREAVRVLEPEGRLVLTAFNSLGCWWLRQQAMRLGASPYLPTGLAPISLYRLKDWLELLGLKIDGGRFGIYRPAFRSAKRLAAWAWLDKAGDRWLPQCSNIILLSAVKRITGPRIVSCDALPAKPARAMPAAGVPAASGITPPLSKSPAHFSSENHE